MAPYGTAGAWDPWDLMGIRSGICMEGQLGIYSRYRDIRKTLSIPSHPTGADGIARAWDPWDLIRIQSGIRSGIHTEGQVEIHSRYRICRSSLRGPRHPTEPMG